MEGSIAFKAFLYKGQTESPSEVRWFYVEQNAIVSFQLVKEKLQATFPALSAGNFTLSWKDCDDDLVSISSDDELLIALTKITTDPRRLYIHLDENAPKSSSSAPNVSEHAAQSVWHQGVVCDACNGEIHGFRYKCIECPDFDLCMTCEMKHEHADHCFLRITDPVASTRLRKCLSHQLGRKLFKHCEREREPKGENRKHYKRHGHGRHGWFETLSKYVSDINAALAEEDAAQDTTTAQNAGAAGTQPETGATPKTAPKNFSRCPFAAGCAPQQGAPEQPAGSGDAQSRPTSGVDLHANYLRNIGQTIANLLDPLGIDVDIDVRTRASDNMETEDAPTVNPTASQNNATQAPKQSEEVPKATATETTTASAQREPSPSATTSQEQQPCNRAVPVFGPDFVPLYTTCSSSVGMSTPIVSAYVNQQQIPMETENGWTFVEGSEAAQQNASNHASDVNNSSSSSASSSFSDAFAQESTTPPKKNTTETPKENPPTTENQNQQGQSTNTTAGGAGGASAGAHAFMGFPGMPFPPPPPGPGFNFDHMARELQKHIQTHFNGTLNAASNVASNVAHRAASAAAANMMNAQRHSNPMAPPTTPPNSGTQSPKSAPKPTTQHPLQPQVNIRVETSTAPAPTAPPQQTTGPMHKNERIARALESMLAMGFNNEGGWLTTVLECTNGDVTKALDLLQPVRK